MRKWTPSMPPTCPHQKPPCVPAAKSRSSSFMASRSSIGNFMLSRRRLMASTTHQAQLAHDLGIRHAVDEHEVERISSCKVAQVTASMGMGLPARLLKDMRGWTSSSGRSFSRSS